MSTTTPTVDVNSASSAATSTTTGTSSAAPTPSSASSSTTAPPTPASASKLKITAKEFNPNAKPFNPAATSFTPSSTTTSSASASGTTTPTTTPSKLNPNSSAYKPATNSSLKPSAAAFNPGNANTNGVNGNAFPQQQPQPVYQPNMRGGPQMNGGYQQPMPPMMMGPQGYYPTPQGMFIPNGAPYFPPQGFVPGYGMPPMTPQQQFAMQQQLFLQHQAQQHHAAQQQLGQQLQQGGVPPQQQIQGQQINNNKPVNPAQPTPAVASVPTSATASPAQSPSPAPTNATPALATTTSTSTATPAAAINTNANANAKPAAAQTPAATTVPKKETPAPAAAAVTPAATTTPATTPAAATPAATPAPVRSAATIVAEAAKAAAEAKATPTPAAATPAATTAPVTAEKIEKTSAAAAAQALGVKPVAPWKPKSAIERKREPKKAEDEEQDLQTARQRANSSAQPADDVVTPAPATNAAAAAAAPANATAAAPVKPVSVSTTATAATPAAAAQPPVSSPTAAKKQTTAEAESSLNTSIQAAAAPRIYNRDYLMQFQRLNLQAPENLQASIEAILKGGDSGGGGDFRPQAGLRPGSNMRPGASGQQSSRIGTSSRITTPVPNSGAPARAGFGTAAQTPRSNNSNQQQGNNSGNRQGNNRNPGRPRQDQPMDIEIVPLQQTENRYRRLTEVPADKKLIRSITSILNKLTPEKFDTLVDQVLELEISSANRLRDVVTAVFEKALAEPNYSPVYADFCVKLSARLPSFAADENDTQSTHNFKRLVLNQCQQEFENQDSTGIAIPNEEDGSLPPGRITQEQFNAMSAEEKEEHSNKLKRRTLGTIRFIGELYRRAMLAAKIMKSCVVLLVGNTEQPNEENIEALCKLLETVGKLLDGRVDNKQPKGTNEFMNNVFGELEKLAQPPSKADREKTESGRPVLSSRIRFMIQDIIDLRRRDWIERLKKEVDAKKISEVDKESASASAPQARPASLVTSSSAGVSRFAAKGKDRYSMAMPEGSPKNTGAGDDGWESVKSSKGRSQDVRGNTNAPNRSNASSTSVSAASTPSHRAAPLSTPSKSRGGNAGGEKEEKKNEPKNAFALLNAGDEEDDESHAGRSARDDERENGDDESNENGNGDADNSSSSSSSKLSSDEIRSRAQTCIKEYFTLEDFNEVKSNLNELGGKNVLNADLVCDGLGFAVEAKEKDRAAYVKLLKLLESNNYLTRDIIEEGFSSYLALSEDIGVDFPLAIEHTAKMLASLIQDSVFDIHVLQRTSKAIPATDDQIKFPTFALQGLKKWKSGEGEFVAYITESGIKWSDLAGESFNAEQLKKHLNDRKLSELIGVL